DSVLIKFHELPEITSQSQRVALVHETVNRLAALLARRDRIDSKLWTCIDVSAHENIRFISLICHQIRLRRSVRVKLHCRIFQKVSPLNCLSDREKYILTIHRDTFIFIIDRMESAVFIKYRNTLL